MFRNLGSPSSSSSSTSKTTKSNLFSPKKGTVQKSRPSPNLKRSKDLLKKSLTGCTILARSDRLWSSFQSGGSRSSRYVVIVETQSGEKRFISLWDNRLTGELINLLALFDASSPAQRPIATFSDISQYSATYTITKKGGELI